MNPIKYIAVFMIVLIVIQPVVFAELNSSFFEDNISLENMSELIEEENYSLMFNDSDEENETNIEENNTIINETVLEKHVVENKDELSKDEVISDTSYIVSTNKYSVTKLNSTTMLFEDSTIKYEKANLMELKTSGDNIKFGFTNKGNYTIDNVIGVQGLFIILDYAPCTVPTGIIYNGVMQYKDSFCPKGIRNEFQYNSTGGLAVYIELQRDVATVFFEHNYDPTVEAGFEDGTQQGWIVYNNTREADCTDMSGYKSGIFENSTNNYFGDYNYSSPD